MSELGYAYGIFKALEPKWTDWKSNHGDWDQCKFQPLRSVLYYFKFHFISYSVRTFLCIGGKTCTKMYMLIYTYIQRRTVENHRCYGICVKQFFVVNSDTFSVEFTKVYVFVSPSHENVVILNLFSGSSKCIVSIVFQ